MHSKRMQCDSSGLHALLCVLASWNATLNSAIYGALPEVSGRRQQPATRGGVGVTVQRCYLQGHQRELAIEGVSSQQHAAVSAYPSKDVTCKVISVRVPAGDSTDTH
eukprot:3577020-Pleurochrysis_carterae.AAC.1